jgi:hypothetical protein
MYITVENYKITQSKKNDLMIGFSIRTKKIEIITLTSFHYDQINNIFFIDYWVGDVRSFSYVFNDIPDKLINLLLKKDIILISENNSSSDNLVVLEEEDNFHYECVNNKHIGDKTE